LSATLGSVKFNLIVGLTLLLSAVHQSPPGELGSSSRVVCAVDVVQLLALEITVPLGVWTESPHAGTATSSRSSSARRISPP
jgi:hypothetical protein